MVVAYAKRLSESLKNICRKHGVQIHFKEGNTIKSFLMAPKDKDPITKKSSFICRYKCDGMECDDEYIRESIYIRVNNPSLNKNIGKYHLPHIWDEVLFNISELKLK